MNTSTDNAVLSATFELQMGAIDYLPESQFGDDLQVAKARASQIEAPFGRLIVRFADFSPLEISDDLLPLTSNLAKTLDSLQRDNVAKLRAFSQPFQWKMRIDGDRIEVINGDGEPQFYPAIPFLDALSQCRLRMATVLKSLQPNDPGWAVAVSRL